MDEDGHDGGPGDTRADAVFHPVRIRVLQALFGGRRLTAQQLLAASGGASIATLYRHLNRMVEAGVLAVVEERPNRGAVEKVYALAHEGAATFTPEEAAEMPAEERMRHFRAVVATLLGDFGRLLERGADGGGPPGDEGVILRQDAFYLTDFEARELGRSLREALAPYKGLAPSAARRRRLLTTVLLPVVESDPIAPDAPS